MTVLGEAKKKEKLKDHYRLGQVNHICLGRRHISFAPSTFVSIYKVSSAAQWVL